MEIKPEQASEVRAASELLAYIRKHYRSIPAFAEENDLDRIKVQKAIRGDIARIDVDFAFAVQIATKGKIKAEWWVSRPLKGAA